MASSSSRKRAPSPRQDDAPHANQEGPDRTDKRDKPKHYFSTFDITSQVFHTTRTALALVNLKPLVPGHVLVIPRRTDAVRLRDLGVREVGALFECVREVVGVVERVWGAEGVTVCVQDGETAGQSIPHVHVHILPRRKGDYTPNDAIYPLLERFGLEMGGLYRARARANAAGAGRGAGQGEDGEGRGPSKVQARNGDEDSHGQGQGGELLQEEGEGWRGPDNEQRRPRTEEAMRAEAAWLASFFPSSPPSSASI